MNETLLCINNHQYYNNYYTGTENAASARFHHELFSLANQKVRMMLFHSWSEVGVRAWLGFPGLLMTSRHLSKNIYSPFINGSLELCFKGQHNSILESLDTGSGVSS